MGPAAIDIFCIYCQGIFVFKPLISILEIESIPVRITSCFCCVFPLRLRGEGDIPYFLVDRVFREPFDEVVVDAYVGDVRFWVVFSMLGVFREGGVRHPEALGQADFVSGN